MSSGAFDKSVLEAVVDALPADSLAESRKSAVNRFASLGFPTVGQEDWTTVFSGNGVAVSGMAGAAINLYREHIDSILFFVKLGYRIRLTGHSMGGSVATLLGALFYRELERRESVEATSSSGTSADKEACLRVYAFGSPACVDAQLADNVDSFVTTVVLHDDVIPRLTPSSCRGLLKHLLHIRETWVKSKMPTA